MLRKLVIGLLCSIVLVAGYMSFVVQGTPGDSRIADTAMQNNLAGVRSLLKQAADVNSPQGDGMTALHWAALNGNPELAEMLINAGANVKAATRLGGYTPLYMAAKAGFPSVIRVLLKAGADAKSQAKNGVTPLMMAASSNSVETVKMLIEAGADVNAAETERGQTALIFAAAFDQPDAIKALMAGGADLNRKSNPMKPAVKVRPVGQQLPPPGQPATKPAQPAAGAAPAAPAPAQPVPSGQVNAANTVPKAPPQILGNAPAKEDPTKAGGSPRGQLTALMYAARQGNAHAVKALVEGGARLDEVSADGTTAVLFASLNGSFDVAKYLVDAGANVNLASMDGTTPLYAVVNTQWAPKSDTPQPTTKYEKTHYIDLMKAMLDKGADPNARLKKDLWYTASKEATNSAGSTPFWKCASVGDLDGMRFLVSRGADHNIANVDGVAPLLVAAGAGFHGNSELTTPHGRLAAVQYLIEELHVDVNIADTAEASDRNNTMNTARSAGGFTALHNAASRGDNAMILYLISKGARVDALSKNGTTVADMANGPRQRVQPYHPTVALLEMLGSANSHRCVSC